MSAINAAPQSQQHDQGTRLASAIERVIRPFIRLIVGRVSCGFLVQQIKRIYIEEARTWIERNDSKGRVTKSKLAMLTGLDTRTISSFEESAISVDEAKLGDLCAEAAVLDAWNSDALYRDQSGQPKLLPILGRGASFQSLVMSAIGRNVTCQTVLERLIDSRNVEVVEENFVRLLSPFYRIVNEAEGSLIDYSSLSANRLLETFNYNMQCKDPQESRLEQSRWSARVKRSEAKDLQNEMRKLVEKQIHDAEKILCNYEQPENCPDLVSFGLGWFFFSDSQ
jgi:hypothetical protein